MADSWEDQAEVAPARQPPAPSKTAAPSKLSLNPNASSFSFNPTASSFNPGSSFSTPKPASTQPAAQPVATSAHPVTTSPQPPAAPTENGTATPSADTHMTDAAELPTTSGVDQASADMSGLTADEEDEDMDEEEESRQEALQDIQKQLDKADNREHMNVVFIGHVDAGKSTTGGQILYLTGGVDERTIQKYEKEAKDKNRESWYMAYIMDTNEEERAKGKTVEVGRALFETEKKRYTILDAPGHKNYVPNMIAGAAQADVGVLVVAARKGEFETGFERGGQTREHAQLAKTLGVAKLVIAINKMDDPSITGPNGEWSKERYDEIQTRMLPFLKSQCGYNPKKDIVFLPMSGLHGTNIKDTPPKNICSWYTGGTLFEVLDNVDPFPRDPLKPFRMSIIDKYRDMGTIAMGKSESGMVSKGDGLFVMPNKVPVSVVTIFRDDAEVDAAKGGENLRIRLTGIEDTEISAGFVLCSRQRLVPAVTFFQAQLQILDLLEHKAVFTAGYKAILHIHSLVEECEITQLIGKVDLKAKAQGKDSTIPVKFVKGNSVVLVRIDVEKPICVERFDHVAQLGRFTLRDEGRTIAIGKIIRLPKSLKEAA
ncbi:hypothetical protein WJX74_007734 [Apatococcus lobatus]|uniref:Tr-type G domain-containing protein n=1 Tax=Apatococcus lobatus TaxID=904363 RepID=A0AAW1S101_9CHLO